MQYAYADGEKILATKNFKRTLLNGEIVYSDNNTVVRCSCGSYVQPKVGDSVIPHWAHFPGTLCTFNREPETPWHLGWKAHLPKEHVEVVLGNNRADILTPYGQVGELQYSGNSVSEVRSRNNAYFAHTGRFPWYLYYGIGDIDRFKIVASYHHKFKFKWNVYRWLNPRKPWLETAKGLLFVDVGTHILYISHHPQKWQAEDGPCLVAGSPISYFGFINGIIKSDEVLLPLLEHSNEVQRILRGKHAEFSFCGCTGCALANVPELLRFRPYRFCSNCGIKAVLTSSLYPAVSHQNCKFFDGDRGDFTCANCGLFACNRCRSRAAHDQRATSVNPSVAAVCLAPRTEILSPTRTDDWYRWAKSQESSFCRRCSELFTAAENNISQEITKLNDQLRVERLAQQEEMKKQELARLEQAKKQFALEMERRRYEEEAAVRRSKEEEENKLKMVQQKIWEQHEKIRQVLFPDGVPAKKAKKSRVCSDRPTKSS